MLRKKGEKIKNLSKKVQKQRKKNACIKESGYQVVGIRISGNQAADTGYLIHDSRCWLIILCFLCLLCFFAAFSFTIHSATLRTSLLDLRRFFIFLFTISILLILSKSYKKIATSHSSSQWRPAFIDDIRDAIYDIRNTTYDMRYTQYERIHEDFF